MKSSFWKPGDSPPKKVESKSKRKRKNKRKNQSKNGLTLSQHASEVKPKDQDNLEPTLSNTKLDPYYVRPSTGSSKKRLEASSTLKKLKFMSRNKKPKATQAKQSEAWVLPVAQVIATELHCLPGKCMLYSME